MTAKYKWDENLTKYIENNKRKINQRLYTEAGAKLYKEIYHSNPNKLSSTESGNVLELYKSRMKQRKYHIGVKINPTLRDLYFYCRLMSVSPSEILDLSSLEQSLEDKGKLYYHLPEKAIIELAQTLNQMKIERGKATQKDSFIVALMTHLESNSVMYLFYNPYFSDEVGYFMTYNTYGKLKQDSIKGYANRKEINLPLRSVIPLENDFFSAKKDFILKANEKTQSLKKEIRKSFEYLKGSEVYKKIDSIDIYLEALLKEEKK